MSDNLIRLFDGNGRVLTELHPDFKSRLLEFGYNDVPERRGRAKPVAQTGAESWVRNRDRYRAMADARESAEFDFIGGVINRITKYVCGKLHVQSATGVPEIDAAYDEYFHNWCGDERAEDGTTMCDLSGRHRFIKQVQMAFRGYMIDGDHGLLEVQPQLSPTGGYCLQSIESDRIGSPNDSSTDEDKIGGIKIDVNTGRILTYDIWQRTRTGSYQNKQEVEAESFIHVIDPERPDEYRGRTKLLGLLNDMRDIREWIEAEKIAGKVQAQWAAIIASKDPFNNVGPDAWTGKTAEGTPTMQADWGKIWKAGAGESISMLAPSARPSGAFMSFIQFLMRKMATRLEISYGFMWDMSLLGGANVRIELESDQRMISHWQENILENRILNRVRQKVIAQGIAQRVLPPHPLWKKAMWHFGRQCTADTSYSMDADVQGVLHGLIPISEVMAKYDLSPGEVFASNFKTANTLITEGAKAGLPGETIARGIFANITNEKAAFNTEAPIPPPPPLSIQAVGKDGIKLIIEVMEKVGEGTIDRESGIAQLIEGYGCSRAEAERVIPEEPAEEDLNRAAGLTPEGDHAPVVAGPKSNGSNGSTSRKNGASSRK